METIEQRDISPNCKVVHVMPDEVYLQMSHNTIFTTILCASSTKYHSDSSHIKILQSYCQASEHHPDCDMLEAAGFGSMANKCTCNSCYQSQIKEGKVEVLDKLEARMGCMLNAGLSTEIRVLKSELEGDG